MATDSRERVTRASHDKLREQNERVSRDSAKDKLREQNEREHSAKGLLAGWGC